MPLTRFEKAWLLARRQGSGPTPPAGPAFHALTPDPDTYEMLGVRTGTGDLTATHTALIYAKDFVDDLYREFAANELVWEDGRTVTNVNRNSEDISDATGYTGGSNMTLTTGVSDPDGGSTATTFTADAGGATRFRRSIIGQPIGVTQASSVYIKRRTGTGRVDFIDAQGGTQEITSAVTTDWQRVTVSALKSVGDVYFGFGLSVSGDEIDVAFTQVETVDGQTNQSPGEYVPTTTAANTKTFANQNGNTVTSNVVTEAVGTALAEVPYLKYQPAATNATLQSISLDLWSASGCSVANDIVGLRGDANGGWTVTGTGNVNDRVDNNITTATSTQGTGVLYYRKSDTTSTQMLFQVRTNRFVEFNPATGAEIGTTGIAAWEWIDYGDVVKVVAETEVGTANDRIDVWPNRVGTGTVGVLNVEYYDSATLAEVRGLGPIFTQAAPVATDAPNYSFDVANHAQPNVYYCEAELSGDIAGITLLALSSINNASEVWETIGLDRWNTRPSGSLVTAPGVGDVTQKLAAIQIDGGSNPYINVDGIWGNNQPSNVPTGVDRMWMTFAASGQFFSGLYAAKIRELRRYDITTYSEGADLVNELMS